jgi:hypothetical protein
VIFIVFHPFVAIVMLIYGVACLLVNVIDPEWFRNQKQMSHQYGLKGMPGAYSGDVGRVLYILIALLFTVGGIIMLLNTMH